MKILSAVAAAALVAASALPAKANGNINIISMTACTNYKAGMEIGRAVSLAAKSHLTYFKKALDAGYSGAEIGRIVVSNMRAWACPDQFRFTRTARPAVTYDLAPVNLRAPRPVHTP